ncbi:hypothetical protein [Actinomadura rubrisoli]|uniref:Uncharacterized protein n=1 Tax=Actinomadura rubrisoli TaxID=2530368 RepID=A0A4R5BUL8_9ACTN|nr:hypothetical protein [Actinomadura rubrisoli]TDD89835.1 hypothetical protein E1298_13655 [Actinomadura rubrisoli]
MPAGSAPPAQGVGRVRPGCPVCGYPIAHEEVRCAECRWLLHGEWRLGAPGPDALRDFDERLAAARRERDLMAVVRAGLSDDAHVRGGTPGPQEWEAARRAVAAPPMSDAALRTALANALHRLGPGRGLVIAEVGVDDALAVIRIRLDDLAIPREHGPSEIVAWETALPMLSRDPGGRRFQLAGGLAGLDRDMLWRALRDGLPQRLDEPGDDVLLVNREIGWPVPDRAVRILRKRHPGAEVVPAGRLGARDLLGPLIAALPARHEVGLLAVDVEPRTRRVRPRLIPLFPAGTPAGTERAVPVARPPGDAAATVLAAIAATPERWTLLAAGSASLPAGGRTDVRLVLDGPGRVRITAPDGLRPVTERLPDLLDGLPDRLDVLTEPVDLICAVELGGVDEQVRRRLDLLRDLVSVLDVTYPGSGLVRVAVLGYRDHAYGRGRERRQTVLGDWLGTPVKAVEALSRLRPSPIEYPEASPVEDVLHEIAARLARSRTLSTGPIPRTSLSATAAHGRPSRTVLLTVGARPPHPPVQGDDDVLPCQFERSWQAALSTITRAGVACATVLHTDGPRDHPVWAALGAAALHDLDDTDGRRLGVGLGLLPPVPQTLNLPLADPERGAR